ncbi:YoaK family protein [Aquibacillus kalidii]|uniref:YoaK family protein n=1 Tax=Aquibacillus kalidii TaxID=2762597 RepID=UPI0016480111|nr:YoaK family protein [Aquibacillus kalidii]
MKKLLFRGKDLRNLSILPSNSIYFATLLTMVGGFLDAYAFMTKDGVFANVQTGNFVFFGINLIEGKIDQAFHFIPPIIAFMLGVAVTENLKCKQELRVAGISGRTIIFMEVVLFGVIGFIPSSVSNILTTSILSFAASLQYSYFRKIANTVYSNTMVTGDLLTVTKSIYYAISRKDKEAAIQSCMFIIIISFFVIGVLLGAFLVQIYANQAIFFVCIPLFIVGILYKSSSRV